jgi:hypothetical protein
VLDISSFLVLSVGKHFYTFPLVINLKVNLVSHRTYLCPSVVGVAMQTLKVAYEYDLPSGMFESLVA